MNLSVLDAENLIFELRDMEISLGRTPETWYTYENHVFGAAKVAQTIALHVDTMDADRAYVCALLHDICRTEENRKQRFHSNLGYEKLINLDEMAARTALTHMFKWHDLPPFETCSEIFYQNKQDYDFIADFMKNHPINDMDLIVQLSDFMANKDGIVTIEDRMKDLAERGRLDVTPDVLQSAYDLKKHFDEKVGKDIYSLFW